MSRSRRLPYHSTCTGARPVEGKQHTSRALRRTVRVRVHVAGEAFDFAHPLDRTRGRAGSRDEDFGWTYFGDGRSLASSQPWAAKHGRK